MKSDKVLEFDLDHKKAALIMVELVSFLLHSGKILIEQTAWMTSELFCFVEFCNCHI